MSKVTGDKWMEQGWGAGDTQRRPLWSGGRALASFQLSSPSVHPTDPRTVKPLFQPKTGKE